MTNTNPVRIAASGNLAPSATAQAPPSTSLRPRTPTARAPSARVEPMPAPTSHPTPAASITKKGMPSALSSGSGGPPLVIAATMRTAAPTRPTRPPIDAKPSTIVGPDAPRRGATGGESKDGWMVTARVSTRRREDSRAATGSQWNRHAAPHPLPKVTAHRLTELLLDLVLVGDIDGPVARA